MNTIPLTRGFAAIVDEADAAASNRFVWTAMVVGKKIYAARRPKIDGRRQWVMLHRWLMDAPLGMDVDHIDGNPLNNRRSNLRLATRSQNTSNSRTVWGVVPYRGVWRGPAGKFRAGIEWRGRQIRLGTFTTPEAAHAAYLAARVRLFGEFAPA